MTQADRDHAIEVCRITGWLGVAKRFERGWEPDLGTSEGKLLAAVARHRLSTANQGAGEWRPVSGWDGLYEVSRAGVVRKAYGPTLRQWQQGNGYKVVRLNNPRRVVAVHRIVAGAFCEGHRPDSVVNHIDCDRTNNCAANLEWCTQAENLAHSARLGRMQKDYWAGRRSPSARLSDDQADAIRSKYALGGITLLALAKEFGTSKRTVGRIVLGQSYRPQETA